MNTYFDFRIVSICGMFAIAIFLAAPVDAQLFNPGDPVLAIDTDVSLSSNYPNSETPNNVTDQNSATKYLNFGKEGTGFIVTPVFGSSTIRSLQLTTANDAEPRDPASYDLYGTNDPITSEDNSFGDQENWTLISSGALSLPPERLTPGPIVDFANATAYTSFKLIFPTVKDPLAANSMQVADAQFFTGVGGTGSAVLANLDASLAVSDPPAISDYPVGETPRNITDQNSATKYLNFGEEGSGAILLPSFGSSTIQSLQLTTANDFPERDPASYELYGTNDAIMSGDNSAGDLENWTLISSGDLMLPDERFTMGAVVNFTNATSYAAYKLIFPTVKDPILANSMQIADAQFFTGAGGTGTGILAAGDTALAVATPKSESDYPFLEGPTNVIDQTLFKYLNFGKENSGFIISRADLRGTIVNSFTITTANDAAERDPTSFELYGTNDPVTSQDNSAGNQENWTLIDMGAIDLPLDRDTESDPILVNNVNGYTAYRLIFPTIRDTMLADSMQIAEVTFDGQVVTSGVVVPNSVTPTRGLFVSGNAGSLAQSDNVDYVMRRAVNDTQSVTQFEVEGTSPERSPFSMEVTLEGAVFARSTVVQTIELWNDRLGSWELIDTRNASNMIDSTVVVNPTGDLSRFVEQTNRILRARIRFQSLNPRQRFSSNTDLFTWSIE